MVTKHMKYISVLLIGSVLAKILMVTKPVYIKGGKVASSVLAKILMVTKHSH